MLVQVFWGQNKKKGFFQIRNIDEITLKIGLFSNVGHILSVGHISSIGYISIIAIGVVAFRVSKIHSFYESAQIS